MLRLLRPLPLLVAMSASCAGAAIAAGCATGKDSTGFPSVGGAGGGAAFAGSFSGGGGAFGGSSGGGWPDAGGHGAYDGGNQEGGTECANGEQKPCYSGLTGTEGVGVCVGGTQTCQAGAWSECGGEIVPSDEQCNGLDDDCDGLDDEDLGQETCGQGICQVTVESCVDGHPQTCTPNPGNTTEQCDGVDDDCDGQVDEGCSCLDGQTQSCYTGDATTKNVGECKGGTQTCSSGVWGSCAGEVKPIGEKCNGLDDDCDGKIDDGNPEGGKTCSTGKQGVCAAGTTSCVSSTLICNQLTQPTAEVCDGLDNNCNGSIDDGNPEAGKVCSTGKPGVCGPGTTQCQSGAVACVQNVQPSTEKCDTIDNNCDGSIDEGCSCVDGTTKICYTGSSGSPGVGICKSGTLTCANGKWGTCVGEVGPAAESCDGVDNDCDGATDENTGGGACATGLFGICAAGTYSCQSGQLKCVQNQQATTEVCNNSLDDDCDGQTDEGCSTGACVHDKCVSGVKLTSGCSPCVTQICASDPFCCNNNWDGICVEEVRTICNSLICPEAQGYCAHSLCVTGAILTSGCDASQANCVSSICVSDGFCCDSLYGSWDGICVNEVQSYCGKNCN